MNKTWVVTVDEDGILPIPGEMMTELDWREGDVLDFDIRGTGSVLIRNITSDERKQVFSALKENKSE